MRSTMRAMLAASLLLGVAGCAGSSVFVASPSACAELIPAGWANGVDHTASPAAAPAKPADQPGMLAWTLDQQKAWTAFAIAEAAKLDQANGRTVDTIGIVSRCEARDAKSVKAARPKVLGIF